MSGRVASPLALHLSVSFISLSPPTLVPRSPHAHFSPPLRKSATSLHSCFELTIQNFSMLFTRFAIPLLALAASAFANSSPSIRASHLSKRLSVSAEASISTALETATTEINHIGIEIHEALEGVNAKDTTAVVDAVQELLIVSKPTYRMRLLPRCLFESFLSHRIFTLL